MHRVDVGWLAAILLGGCSGGSGGGGGCPAPVLEATNGTALVLEGGHVEIEAATLTSYEDATLQAWVRLADDLGADRQIAGKGRPGETPAFVLFADGGENPAVGFDDGGGGFETSVAVAGDIPLGTWTHVAVAWNTSSLAFYVNGAVVVNTTTVTGPAVASDAPIFLGGGLDEGGQPWAGDIDEVRLWAGAHDVGQILGDYESMMTGLESELLAAWNFEESGRTVADVMPACHSGKVKGEYSRTSDAPF